MSNSFAFLLWRPRKRSIKMKRSFKCNEEKKTFTTFFLVGVYHCINTQHHTHTHDVCGSIHELWFGALQALTQFLCIILNTPSFIHKVYKRGVKSYNG